MSIPSLVIAFTFPILSLLCILVIPSMLSALSNRSLVYFLLRC